MVFNPAVWHQRSGSHQECCKQTHQQNQLMAMMLITRDKGIAGHRDHEESQSYMDPLVFKDLPKKRQTQHQQGSQQTVDRTDTGKKNTETIPSSGLFFKKIMFCMIHLAA